MMSNLQILTQFVTALHRMSSEIMSIGVGHVVFPTEDVAKLSRTPRAQRAAKYMIASTCSRASTDIVLHILYEM